MSIQSTETDPSAFERVRDQLCEAIAGFYKRGWCLGTGGNFSVADPDSTGAIWITPSGVHKGETRPDQLLWLGSDGECKGAGKPSAETGIHQLLYERGGGEVGCVLHTHSVWSTLLSERYVGDGGFTIEGYEMLKGLRRVETHDTREWVPVVENSQDIPALCGVIDTALRERPHTHGFLLSGHGLYTWGHDVAEAKRHVEIYEFLFEVRGRKQTMG